MPLFFLIDNSIPEFDGPFIFYMLSRCLARCIHGVFCLLNSWRFSTVSYTGVKKILMVYFGKSKRRQRLEDLPESKTVTKLISLIGTGGSHVNVAHDLVQTVRDDGFDNPALATFASCGAYGRHDANTERDLLRWLRGLWGVHLEPYEIKLQLQAWLVSQFFCCTSIWSCLSQERN